MATVTAGDNSVTVIIKESGARGIDGTAGTDGLGFDNVRQLLVNNPLVSVLHKNNESGTIDGGLTSTRSTVGTFTNRAGLIEESAVDDLRQESDGWLIEESRENKLLRSEDFLNSAWLQSLYNGGAQDFWTVTAATGDIEDIYGTNLATKFVATATPADLFGRQSGLSLSAVDHVASVWIYVPTQAGVSNFSLRTDYNDADQKTSAAITDFDEWVRFENLSTLTAARTSFDMQIKEDGVSPSAGFIFYAIAAQVEPASFASTYIKTVASAITRGSDVVSFTPENNLLQDLATINFMIPALKANTGADRHLINVPVSAGLYEIIADSSADTITFNFYNGTVVAVSEAFTADSDTYITASISATQISLTVNGSTSTALTSTAPLIDLTGQVYIGSSDGTSNYLNDKILGLTIYDFVLNSDEINLFTAN